ncbi:MAG: hypothetical protein QM528_00460 [Phycisphaerales bacterium]|nr:hypothetical protein [Phycisphaerales bacterium]
MDSNKILGADILEIIFENRNKEYGAYDLRKTYPQRLKKAILGAFILTIISFVLYYLSGVTSKTSRVVYVQDVSLESIQEQKKPEPPPPPPPPKPIPPKIEIAKFTPPKIVKDQDVKPEDRPPDLKQLENTKIGNFNQKGLKDEGTVAPVQRSTGVSGPKQDNEDYNKVFTVVQIPATYPGGMDAWRKFLQRNLNQNVPIDNGAPAGVYAVTLTFIVDKTGNISDIQVETDPGYGTAQEAVRVLKKGGGWQPAIQNGRKVIYRNRQTIVFQVNEE